MMTTLTSKVRLLKTIRATLFALIIPALLLGLTACGQKNIPFTDYIIENLLRDNLNSLAEPAIFEVQTVTIVSSESEGDRGSALVDV